MPQAEKFAGARGTTTVGISSSSATAAANRPPPPPYDEHRELARIETTLDRDPRMA